ncbi:MAG: RsmB/NOP family class I SAM-dependent RNA methyltransferase [Rhodospirillales bacterium]|nr:RsmB/NOP family class I SAM-dependent RNA methyltransferase [Rhodospirillales bacterium]
MTPGARIQAAIELIEAIGGTDAPVDGIVERFVRARRYMGSKDRRSVTGRVYGILRRYGRLSWWLAEYAVTSRALVLADLALHADEREAEFDALFSGLGHAPEPLDEEEQALAARLSGQTLNDADMPDWVSLEYSDWLDGPLKAAFGEALVGEMTALNSPAPLDLRINSVRADVNMARKVLADEQIKTERTPYSPLAIRVLDRINLRGSRAFREGLIEVQDEGSQIISALCGAKPGMTVVDYCAGAGGKTLALAAQMATDGVDVDTLWACDTQERFLGRLSKRTARAGVEGIQQHVLAETDDAWIAENEGFADVVLVDAPCSGMGTWRRNPGAKWSLTAERLDESVARQSKVLETAARLTRPGGRMIYATCSLLREENEDRVEAFLAAHPDFAPIPVSDVWAETFDIPCPTDAPYLRLSPATTGTDGFFCAILTRLT